MNTIEITITDNEKIIAQVFETAESNKILIIAGAMGTKQTFYSKFAEFLMAKGITVITFDYSGIGKSLIQPISKVKSNVQYWGNVELECVLQYVITNHPNKKVYVLGHSVGGQLIGLAPSASAATKIILVAAQSGYWKLWEGFSKYKMWATWYILFPSLIKMFGYMPSKNISGMENLPQGVAMQWSKWCISPGYLFDNVKEEGLHYSKIKCPVISFSCDDDAYAPKASVDWMTEQYNNAVSERIHLSAEALAKDKIGHFGFFKPKFKNDIWEIIVTHLMAGN